MEYTVLTVLILVIAFQGWERHVERGRAIARESELLQMVLAQHLPDYAANVGLIKETPQTQIDKMKVENKLAQAAAKLEEKKEAGIRVT